MCELVLACAIVRGTCGCPCATQRRRRRRRRTLVEWRNGGRAADTQMCSGPADALTVCSYHGSWGGQGAGAAGGGAGAGGRRAAGRRGGGRRWRSLRGWNRELPPPAPPPAAVPRANTPPRRARVRASGPVACPVTRVPLPPDSPRLHFGRF
ncbi:Protein of unknown function [Gryllus bimaculatus]|nr:Protein of unknown function [Gryllus bimaculatus]